MVCDSGNEWQVANSMIWGKANSRGIRNILGRRGLGFVRFTRRWMHFVFKLLSGSHPRQKESTVPFIYLGRIKDSIGTVQFSRSVMSDSLWPHGLQHARLSCSSPTPGAYSNSCPLYQWCHAAISSSDGPYSHLQFLSIRVFSNELVLHIRWPKYWSFSFSINPSNEYLGLISFRMDWLDLLA